MNQICECCKQPLKKRTTKQRNALELWLKQYADACNEKGVTLEMLLSQKIEHHVTPEVLKGFCHDIGRVMFGVEKTSEMTSQQLSKVIEVLAKVLAERSEIFIPFPSNE
jgi:hypothetical protein